MITYHQCRAARAWIGLTQRELAVLANLNHNSVHAWEAGKTTPHANNIEAIERVLTERGIRFVSDPLGVVFA